MLHQINILVRSDFNMDEITRHFTEVKLNIGKNSFTIFFFILRKINSAPGNQPLFNQPKLLACIKLV